MRAGGLMLFGIGGIIGATAADLAARYVTGLSPAQYAATGATPPTYPTAQTGATVTVSTVPTYNDYAQAARPGMYSIGAQLAIALLGFIVGGVVNTASIKAIMYGVGIGAGLHLATQLLNAYVLEPLFSGSDAGARMYQHEWNADGAFGAGTMSGPPAPAGQMGTVPSQFSGQGARGARVPTALATLRASMPQNPFAGAMGQALPGTAMALRGGSGVTPQPTAQGMTATTPAAPTTPTNTASGTVTGGCACGKCARCAVQRHTGGHVPTAGTPGSPTTAAPSTPGLDDNVTADMLGQPPAAAPQTTNGAQQPDAPAPVSDWTDHPAWRRRMGLARAAA